MIELSEQDPPQTVEAQLVAAIYSATMYHKVTKIVRGHRVCYVVSEYLMEQHAPDLIKDAQ